MSQSADTKLNHSLSVVVAFHKLLKASRQKAEVLLLDVRDNSANRAMQEYNDSVSEVADDQAYRQFVDRLAERFSKQEQTGKEGMGNPVMPNRGQLEEADRILSVLMEKITKGTI